MRHSIPIIVLTVLVQCTVPEPKETDKTLVSWVSLSEEEEEMVGTVITLQDGDRFDGILIDDRDGIQWMAGNQEWKKIPEDPDGEPKKAPERGKLVQMAAVYSGDLVRLYQDGKLLESRNLQPFDLLNSENNFVLFGRTHLTGEGYISVSIEDARIYSQALSPGELNKLKPDKPSEITPYAWWDFEGEEITERTGRYDFHNLGEGEDLELVDGKLVLDRWGTVIATRAYSPETPAWPSSPPENWPAYHLAHPGPGVAEPGDPNPGWFYKGKYHLHYIYHIPHGFMFAHVSSTDMVHWKWHPTVLGPPKHGHGMFSGTGFFTREGQPAMIYHGIGSGYNQIALALDDDLDEWTQPWPVIPVDEHGGKLSINQWDPDCWMMDDTFYALSGGEDPDLMKSDDLENWKYLGKLLHEDYPDHLWVSREEDISCANMFPIGNRWMLLCISHHLGCRYFLGDFKDEKYLPDFHARMNWRNTNWEEDHGGLVYFAPESILAEDGRRVMWAWIITELEPSGIQSLPRQLELPEDGILRIKPLKELESLRYAEKSWKNLVIEKDQPFTPEDVKGNALEFRVVFKAPLPGEFGISLLGDENGEDALHITAGADMESLSVGPVDPPFTLQKDENLTLQIFIDKQLVEVFANDRQAAAAAHKHFREDPDITLFTKDGPLSIEELKIWKMKSIY
ncbi:MAG: GH32 C-terminal domain-containing protein [Bacteroidales bacterium]